MKTKNLTKEGQMESDFSEFRNAPSSLSGKSARVKSLRFRSSRTGAPGLKQSRTLAQSVERGTENPCVLGSIPRGATVSKEELNTEARKLCDEGLCISMGEARRVVIKRRERK